MEQLIDQIARTPVGTKIGAILLALAMVTVFNYYVVGVPYGSSITAIEDQKQTAEQELQAATADLGLKKQIANDLNRFRRQRELLQQQFQEARAELPDQIRMDDLLQAFQEKAGRSGLEISKIEPRPIVPASAGEFYAKIPISMEVDGNFHEIATFFDALGRMQRIVNVSDILLDSPKDVNGRVVLTAKFTATTFMFVEEQAAAARGNR